MPHGSSSQSGCFNGNYKHGGKGTKLYEVWCSMRARCNRPTAGMYERYGGRGIRVCKEWDDFPTFREWAQKSGYKEDLSIERKDNDGDYCPENCVWATAKEQANNQSTTLKIKMLDVEKPLHVWADFLGLNPDTLYYRIKRGWSVERALFEKPSLNKHGRGLEGGTDNG